MKCDSAHMLRQAARGISRKGGGVLIFSVEEMARHIQEVRDGSCTLEEFADFYMIRPTGEAAACPTV